MGWGTFGNLERLLAVEGRDGDVSAERQGREADGHITVEVVTVSHEDGMVLDMHDHV